MGIDWSSIRADTEVSRLCYTDPEIFAAEQEQLFRRTWQFVAHESELAAPGDFRATDIAGEPVLAVRGDDRAIRVFLNTCRHRGALVEPERCGNRNSFRCLYHHWEYGRDGALRFVPRPEGYEDSFDPGAHGLVPLPRVEAFEGLIFACFDPAVEPLETFLGPAAPYVDYIANYEGVRQVAMGVNEFTYNANWKLLYENTLDDYHPEFLHATMFRQRAKAGVKGTHQGAKDMEASRLPTALGIHGALRWGRSSNDPGLSGRAKRTRQLHIAVFPGFLGLYATLYDVTSLRILKPEAPDRTRVLHYCLVPPDASEAERREIGHRFPVIWGPGSQVNADDFKAFEYVQRGLKARNAGNVLIARGAGGGEVGGAADEQPIRAFWRGWRHYMLDGGMLHGGAGADARAAE